MEEDFIQKPTFFTFALECIFDGNVNCILTNGRTLLIESIENNMFNIFSSLLENGADPNFILHNGLTALFYACKVSNIEMVRMLVEYGADINAKDEEGRNVLMYAIKKSKTNCTEYLLKVSSSELINEQNNDGENALIISIKKQSTFFVSFIISKGCKINQTNYQGQSPFFVATLIGNLKIMQLLLQNGADINLTDINGYSPLMAAINLNNFDTTNFFIRNSKYIKINNNNNGLRPIDIAILNGNVKILNLFLRTNFSNLYLFNGPILFRLIEYSFGKVEMIKFLVSKGTNMNILVKKDDKHISPLIMAIKNRDYESFTCLLELGASPNFYTDVKPTDCALAIADQGDFRFYDTLREYWGKNLLSFYTNIPFNF